MCSTLNTTLKLPFYATWAIALCLIISTWVVADGTEDAVATYLSNHLVDSGNLKRVLRSPNSYQRPDTTIVLLNWSRLQNVVLQASVYCGPSLRDIVEQVVVWNNQPNIKLDYDQHFAHTGCTTRRLQIFNSPSNLYFQARFMGCINSHSRYCFLQDDDYVTRPEILRNVRACFSDSDRTLGSPSPIILLPAHDHMETDLLATSVSDPRFDPSVIITSFACLGHGTFLLQSQATAFLSLLRQLKLSEEEMKIADNYFTLLGGKLPNTWFTHTIELHVGTRPFTAGVEGSERNWKHVEHAMEYLHYMTHANPPRSWPHFTPLTDQSSLRPHTAPCISGPCTISSNIHLLSRYTTPQVWAYGTRMRDIQAQRLFQLGQEGARWYIDHPVSKAVDGDVETAFRSAGSAKAGDHVTLTLLQSELGDEIIRGERALEIAWLVDTDTASALHTADLECSGDGVHWHPLMRSDLTCFSTTMVPPDIHIRSPFLLGSPLGTLRDTHLQPTAISENMTVLGASLQECYVRLTKEQRTSKHLRIVLGRDMDVGWAIYEVWLRGG